MAPYVRALLAETYTPSGKQNEGWVVLAETLDEVDQGEGRFYAAGLHRLKGELLLRQAMTNASQAEACFQQALDLAHQSQAKWWELRAAMSLSRLWQRQGKRDTARQLLAKCTVGSPRDLIPLTFRKPKRSSTNCSANNRLH